MQPLKKSLQLLTFMLVKLLLLLFVGLVHGQQCVRPSTTAVPTTASSTTRTTTTNTTTAMPTTASTTSTPTTTTTSSTTTATTTTVSCVAMNKPCASISDCCSNASPTFGFILTCFGVPHAPSTCSCYFPNTPSAANVPYLDVCCDGQAPIWRDPYVNCPAGLPYSACLSNSSCGPNLSCSPTLESGNALNAVLGVRQSGVCLPSTVIPTPNALLIMTYGALNSKPWSVTVN